MPRSPHYIDPMNNVSKEHYRAVTAPGCDPISREEETRLFHAHRAGDPDALEKVIKANMRFALQQAGLATGRGIPLDDLVAAANAGLLIAAKKFDPERGYKFISYAVWWIRQQINKEVTDNRRNIRVNGMADKQVQRQSCIRWTMAQKLGRHPSRAEVLDEYEDQHGLIPTHWDAVQAAYGGTASLDEILNDDGEKLNGHGILADENTPDPIDNVQAEAAQAAIKDALSGLPEREADILALYFGLLGTVPHTLDQIGTMYGLTRERVRQIRNRALAELKQRRPDLSGFCE